MERRRISWEGGGGEKYREGSAGKGGGGGEDREGSAGRGGREKYRKGSVGGGGGGGGRQLVRVCHIAREKRSDCTILCPV